MNLVLPFLRSMLLSLVDKDKMFKSMPMLRYFNSEFDLAGLRQLCSHPDDGDLTRCQVIKRDGTTTVYKLEIDGISCIMKRYNTKNFWHRIRRNFKLSRAKNSLAMSQVFNQCGLKTATPIAVVEYQLGPISGVSWFVSEFVESDQLLQSLKDGLESQNSETLIEEMTNVFAILRDNKLSHGDMKATNLLVKNNAVTLIDLDASKQHVFKFMHQRALQKDKNRFLKNWRNQPALHDHFLAQFKRLGI